MKFTLVTDHKPLLWLHCLKDPIARVARWKILLREYDYEIVHKPGKINMNADALSRNPLPIQHIALSPPPPPPPPPPTLERIVTRGKYRKGISSF